MAKQKSPAPVLVNPDRESDPVVLLEAMAGRFGALAVWYLIHHVTGLHGNITDGTVNAAVGLARSAARYANAARLLRSILPRR